MTDKEKICPICKDILVLEPYEDNPKIKLETCRRCGYPYLSKLKEFYKEKPHKLDFLYAFLEYLNDIKGVKIPKAANGNILSTLVPGSVNWNVYDKVRGGILYAIINVSKTGDFYEFRGIYSNPYFAELDCDEINAENEERGIIAIAHVESILLNHPVSSCMFK